MSLDRMVVFALLFLVIYFASVLRAVHMTAYREQKLVNSQGRYIVVADTVWWEIIHLVKNGMILMAVGQIIFLWVEAQPWFAHLTR